MRGLLDSSWMRFAPAGREHEWPTAAALVQHKQEESLGGLDLAVPREYGLQLYMLLPLCCLLVLVVLVGLWFRRCARSKLGPSHVIALGLPDAESQADEILSSLTRNAERLNSTSSDGSDGVFVMVYLPPPYEQTLSRITRASLSSEPDSDKATLEFV